ncbi:MAG: NAD-dependent deacylase [Thermoanaerobaculia bacterium]
MEDQRKVEELKGRLEKCKNLVVFTGAGISKESGIPTFRDADGLWKNFRVEELATPEAFENDPVRVWEWYLWRKEKIGQCQPNLCHLLVSKWEKQFENFWLITQNIDGLHRKAGNKKILELHGNIWYTRCIKCGDVKEDLSINYPSLPPKCSCGGILRPHIVWFGEALDSGILNKAMEVSQEAEVFVSIGTSTVVYPAASLPFVALQSGAYVVEVNPERTSLTSEANINFFLKATQFASLFEDGN